MSPTLYYAIGGVIGAALRSGITTSQATFSRKSLVDLIVGALIGVVYPLYPLVAFPEQADLIQKAAIIAVLSYAGGDFIQNVLNRIGGVQKLLGAPGA